MMRYFFIRKARYLKDHKGDGSVLIFVIIAFGIIFTLLTGAMATGLSLLSESRSFGKGDVVFYKAESAAESMLYYLDRALDDARSKANSYCYTEGGGLNLASQEIWEIYQDMLEEEDLDDKTLKEYEEKIKAIYLKRYKEYVWSFFEKDEPLNISSKVDKMSWQEIRCEVIGQLERENAEIEISRFGEVDSDSEFYSIMKKVKKGKEGEFEYFGKFNDDGENIEAEAEIKKFPRETIYIRASLKGQETRRYMVLSFEMNPFGIEYDEVGFDESKIRMGFNRALDYTVVVGKNLIVLSEDERDRFYISGDVYVRGSGNNIDEAKASPYFGGIIAGLDEEGAKALSKAEINPLTYTDLNFNRPGRIYIKGDVLTGDTQKDEYNEYFNSGFVKTGYAGSEISINGNLYCHSIVTEENAEQSLIAIDKNAYIADNVSLNAPDSKIDIKKSLIGFEMANSNNYNQSASIVVNDTSSRLTIGKNIILFGVAFVDGLERKEDNKAFRTVETSSIFPNYLAYSHKIEDENKFDDYYSTFKFVDSDTQADFFDRDHSKNPPLISAAVEFLLKYINQNTKAPNLYPYNFAEDVITAENMNFDERDSEDTSYFPLLLTADGKVYLAGDIEGVDSSTVNELKEKQRLSVPNVTRTVLESNLRGKLQNIKQEFIQCVKFRDKGKTKAEGFEDYFDWKVLDQGKIKINSEDVFILITNEDIAIGREQAKDMNGKSVLLVGGGEIYITGELKFKGNMISRGNIFLERGSVEIESDEHFLKQFLRLITKRGISHGQLHRLIQFLTPGISLKGAVEEDFVTTFNKTAETNIRILNRQKIYKNRLE